MLIVAAVQEQTGRRLEIGGPVKLRIFPARVLIDDVRFANAPGGSKDVMIKVKRVGVRLKLADLIRGKLALSIDLSEPDVLLETVVSGEKNWLLSIELPAQLAFAQMSVSCGQVVFRKHQSGNVWRLAVGELLIRERLTGGYAGRLEANLNDMPVKLDVDVRPEEDIAGKKETLSIDGQADISGAKLKFDGLASKDIEGPIVKGNIRADINLTISVEKLLTARNLTIQNLQTNIVLAGGRLSLKPSKMHIARADFKFKGAAEGLGRENTKILINLNASVIDLGRLLNAVSGTEELKGGLTEVVADLQASGRSPAKLASTLKGHVRVSVGPGQLNNRNLDTLLGDVFAGVIKTINPFYTEEKTSELKCLVVNVPVKDGVVLIDDTLALETNKVGVSLAGFVNLNTEKLDLLARPKAKKGLGIGVDLLSDLVRIRGTLANPQTEIDPAGVAKTTILRGIDVATFGLTALYRGQTSKLSADQMCAEALRTRTTTSTGKGKHK